MKKIGVVLYCEDDNAPIKRCISSILRQSEKDIAIHVIEPEVSQKVAGVLEQYQGFEQITISPYVFSDIINDELEIISEAMQVCNCEHLFLCSAADVLSPLCFEKMYTAAQEQGAAITYCDYSVVQQNKASLSADAITGQEEPITLLTAGEIGNHYILNCSLSLKLINTASLAMLMTESVPTSKLSFLLQITKYGVVQKLNEVLVYTSKQPTTILNQEAITIIDTCMAVTQILIGQQDREKYLKLFEYAVRPTYNKLQKDKYISGLDDFHAKVKEYLGLFQNDIDIQYIGQRLNMDVPIYLSLTYERYHHYNWSRKQNARLHPEDRVKIDNLAVVAKGIPVKAMNDMVSVVKKLPTTIQTVQKTMTKQPMADGDAANVVIGLYTGGKLGLRTIIKSFMAWVSFKLKGGKT